MHFSASGAFSWRQVGLWNRSAETRSKRQRAPFHSRGGLAVVVLHGMLLGSVQERGAFFESKAARCGLHICSRHWFETEMERTHAHGGIRHVSLALCVVLGI